MFDNIESADEILRSVGYGTDREDPELVAAASVEATWNATFQENNVADRRDHLILIHLHHFIHQFPPTLFFFLIDLPTHSQHSFVISFSFSRFLFSFLLLIQLDGPSVIAAWRQSTRMGKWWLLYALDFSLPCMTSRLTVLSLMASGCRMRTPLSHTVSTPYHKTLNEWLANLS